MSQKESRAQKDVFTKHASCKGYISGKVVCGARMGIAKPSKMEPTPCSVLQDRK